MGGERRLGEGVSDQSSKFKIWVEELRLWGGGGMPRVNVSLHQCVCQFRESACLFQSDYQFRESACLLQSECQSSKKNKVAENVSVERECMFTTVCVSVYVCISLCVCSE